MGPDFFVQAVIMLVIAIIGFFACILIFVWFANQLTKGGESVEKLSEGEAISKIIWPTKEKRGKK